MQTSTCHWHQTTPSTRKQHKFWTTGTTRPTKSGSGPFFRGTAQHEIRDPAAARIASGSSVSANTTSDSCYTTPYGCQQRPETLSTTNLSDGPTTPLPRAHCWRVASGPELHDVAKRAGSRRPQRRTSRKHGNRPTHGPGINAPSPLETFSIMKPSTVPCKLPFIQDLLQDTRQLFCALTVTWLKDHLDAELKIDGYTLFRQDCLRQNKKRRGRDCGGVAFYLRDDLAATAEPVLKFSNGVTEVLGGHVKSANLVLVVLYQQPDNPGSGQRSTNKEFRQALNEIKTTLSKLPTPTADIVFCRDFNLPHMNWPDGTPVQVPVARNSEWPRILTTLQASSFSTSKLRSQLIIMGTLWTYVSPTTQHSYTAINAAQQSSRIII